MGFANFHPEKLSGKFSKVGYVRSEENLRREFQHFRFLILINLIWCEV